MSEYGRIMEGNGILAENCYLPKAPPNPNRKWPRGIGANTAELPDWADWIYGLSGAILTGQDKYSAGWAEYEKSENLFGWLLKKCFRPEDGVVREVKQKEPEDYNIQAGKEGLFIGGITQVLPPELAKHFQKEDKMPLFEVAIVQKTQKAGEEIRERLVLGPTPVIAKDDKGAALAAGTLVPGPGVDLSTCDVLVRKFC